MPHSQAENHWLEIRLPELEKLLMDASQQYQTIMNSEPECVETTSQLRHIESMIDLYEDEIRGKGLFF